MKPGWKTTEFWLIILSNVATVLTMVAGVLPAKYGVPIMTAVSGLYAVLRTLGKVREITTVVTEPKV